MDQHKYVTDAAEIDSLESAFGVCKTDDKERVIYQNSECKRLCGHRLGKICDGPCIQKMKIHNPNKISGTFQFKCESVLKGLYDILVLKNRDYSIKLLFDLEEKRRDINEHLKSYGLTQRELEIADLASQNLTNSQIASKLCISPKTLKTHINNILKKIPRYLWQDISERNQI